MAPISVDDALHEDWAPSLGWQPSIVPARGPEQRALAQRPLSTASTVPDQFGIGDQPTTAFAPPKPPNR